MTVFIGLIAVLVVLMCARTMLTDRAGTHDSFAVLSQRVSAVRKHGRRNNRFE